MALRCSMEHLCLHMTFHFLEAQHIIITVMEVDFLEAAHIDHCIYLLPLLIPVDQLCEVVYSVSSTDVSFSFMLII